MNYYMNDDTIIDYLRGMSGLSPEEDARERKVKQMTGYYEIKSCRDQQMAEVYWPGYMSMIFRNEPDSNGNLVTILPNIDTTAALLAVRLGITPSVAVALAFHDVICACPINDGAFHNTGVQWGVEMVALATFQHEGKSVFSLLARADAANFRFEYEPEEPLLMHQGKSGLFWGYDGYDFDCIKDVVSYRRDQPIIYEFDGDRLRLRAWNKHLATLMSMNVARGS